ncbi:MAG: MFS transporter [Phycisphaerae bacterium]|nr:MFS transporter [Phycisphaerae bacterium]
MTANKSTQSRLPNLLVRNPNFVLLWAAYGISAFGDHLSEMALLRESGGFDRDDITRVQALMTFCFFLPFVFIGPLAGWWADRFSRKWTMVVSDFLRAAIVFSIPFAFASGLITRGLENPATRDFIIALPLLLTGIFAAFFSPARQAMVPTLIRDDQLVRANAMISALGTIGAILSGLIGGWLVDLSTAGHLHLDWNYRLDALTFVASGILITGIVMSRTRATKHELPAGIWTPLRQGFAYVLRHRRVLQMVLLATVFWAAAGVVISVVPAIVRDVFGGQYSDAGMYRGLIAAGLAVGATLLTIVGPSLPVQLAVLAAVLGGGVWLLALDATVIFKLGRVMTALSLFMIGVHGAGILVTVMVIIQRFVPDSRRGRVFGVSDMCTMAAIVATTGLLGLPHIEHLDRYIPWLLGVTGVGMFITLGVAWRIYRRHDAERPMTRLMWLLIIFYAHFWARTKRVGPCTVPRRGPVILAANHTSGIDPLAMLATCRNRVISFLVEQKYYAPPLARWFMEMAHCVPVDRDKPAQSFFRNSLRLLKHGGLLGIFPQGTYEPPDDPIPPAKPGIGTLALRSGATVIPCHLSGTTYVYNPFACLFRRHSVRIRYGPPIDLSAFQGREKDQNVAQEVADHIMRKINALAP